jgi:hypothetical protein
MWNAWTAPPGARPSDYDPWSCEAHCARCGELAQDCHCDEEDEGERMATKVYGQSDDLIEFDGEVSGEVGYYDSHEGEEGAGALIIFSDGTVLNVRYGKAKQAIWQVTAISKGTLFQRIDECSDEDAAPYSDIAYFADGLKWAYAAKDWERVK